MQEKAIKTTFIPCKVETQNRYQYRHWWYYKRYRDKWEKYLLYILGRNNQSAFSQEKRKIKIVSLRRRLIDMGNLVGGTKPIPDILIKLGWIYDDSPKWVEIEYEQRKIKSNTRDQEGTIIEIY